MLLRAQGFHTMRYRSCLLWLALPFSVSLSYADTQLFVSPVGNDAWTGSLSTPNVTRTDGPKRTLLGARDELRMRRSQGPLGTVTVFIAPGRYLIHQPLTFDSRDSGVDGAPVVFRGMSAREVVLDGSAPIGRWRHTRETRIAPRFRRMVFEAPLSQLGNFTLGAIPQRGWNMHTLRGSMELFADERPMTPAQWPNEGYAIVRYTGPAGFRLDRMPTRPWRSLDRTRVSLFNLRDWRHFLEPVTGFDPATSTFRTSTFRPDGMGYAVEDRVKFVHVLEELDAPGEYYIDQRRRVVLFWPRSGLASLRSARVSMLDGSMLDLRDSQHIRFENLTLQNGRASAIRSARGESIAIRGLTIRNFANHAIHAEGHRYLIRSNDIHDIGESGIHLVGGDRFSLTSSGSVVENNDITRVSQQVRTYRPAVQLDTVGAVIRNNRMHELPHAAIHLRGNDNLIEGNHIHDVCLETSDSGAIYMGRNFADAGNVIRNNLIQNVQKHVRRSANCWPVVGIYLDDMATGTVVEGNIMDNVQLGMLIGGGRDNVILNNLFMNVVEPLVLDARAMGMTEAARHIPTMLGILAQFPYQSGVWAERYPWLVNIAQDDPGIPKRNRIERNLVVGTRPMWFQAGVPRELIRNNFLGLDAGLRNKAAYDFTPIPGGPASQIGFVAPEMDTIGLRTDTFRTQPPSPLRPPLAN